jgi:hypothetical protein
MYEETCKKSRPEVRLGKYGGNPSTVRLGRPLYIAVHVISEIVEARNSAHRSDWEGLEVG